MTWTEARTAQDARLDAYLGVPWETAGVLEIASAFEAIGDRETAQTFRNMWETSDDFIARQEATR